MSKEELVTQGLTDAARGNGISAAKLRTETDFMTYIKLLQLFAQRYTVIVTSADTPSGPLLTPELAADVMKIGYKINLFQQFRLSYAAVVDAGELIIEQIASERANPVLFNLMINDIPVHVESNGFYAPKQAISVVRIGERNCRCGKRGLTFVVFDKVLNEVLDVVMFDPFGVGAFCDRPSMLEDAVIKYKKTHPGIHVLCHNFPLFPTENLSENERFINQNNLNEHIVLANADKPVFALNKYCHTADEVREVITAPKSYHDAYGIRRFEDKKGKHVNTSAGHRITIGQPNNYVRTIFTVGGCGVYGIGATDSGTIASHLQRLLNEAVPEQRFIVQNYGYFLADIDRRTNEEANILNALPAKPNDIVLLSMAYTDELTLLDLSSISKRPHNHGELFWDRGHLTEDGYRVVAECLFAELQRENFYDKASANSRPTLKPMSEHSAGIYSKFSREHLQELEKYKKILTEFYDSMFGIKIGSIVMNCNPFTLGHRYLIEQALSMCDYLIIFIVQEDKSEFSFDDRLNMLDAGVADLSNVTVIPSGNFIISTLTFEDYFNKSNLQERKIDASLDVTLFAQEIAPCLHINMRFVGEEPFDAVTKQYNDSMRDTFSLYGIEFIEIPRKEAEGIPISASRVRNLLIDKDFDAVATLVPKTTYDYLLNRFGKQP